LIPEKSTSIDIDDVSVDAVDSGAEGFEKHKGESLVGIHGRVRGNDKRKHG
jgi:hypothetical protein